MDRTRHHQHRARLILLTGLLCSAFPFSAKGQEVLAGVTADIAQEYQQTEIPVFAASSPGCGVFETGWETLASLGAQVSLASRSGSRLGLTARLTLSPSSGLLTTPAPESFTFYREEGIDSGKLIRADHEYQLEIKGISLKLDFLLDYSITERLRIHLGPSFSFILGNTVNQSDYITDATYRFGSGVREQEMPRTELLITQKLIIGGRAGLSYSIPISENIVFVPEVLMRTEFTPLFQQADRLSFGPGIGFSLLTRLADGYPDRDTTIDDIPPPETTAALPLRASIALHGTDEFGEALPWGRIRVYETMRRDNADGEWRTERQTVPPILLVEPDYASANGIREWNILFRYKGEVIGRASSREDSPLTSMDWKITDGRESDSTHPLTVELTVTDSAGITVTTTDQIPLKIERLTRIVDNRGDTTLYTLYPVADDSAEATRRNNLVLREAVGTAAEGGRIEVVKAMKRNDDGSAPDVDPTGPLAGEATSITNRLRQLLEEGRKNIPVENSTRIVEFPPYAGMSTEQTTHSVIEIMLIR